MELVHLGKVHPIVGARLPLEQLNEALRLAHNAEVFGRIILGVFGWGLGIKTLQLPEQCGGQAIYGTGAGILGYTGLAYGTRDGQRRVVDSFNTASNDPTSLT